MPSSNLTIILRLPRKIITIPNLTKISGKQRKRHFQRATDPSWTRAGSENDPSMTREWNRHPQPPLQPRLLCTPSTSTLYWKLQHVAPNLTFKHSPSSAPATKSDTWTSSSAAPATQNDSHDWSSSHMKRYLQCAEQQMSLYDLTLWFDSFIGWLYYYLTLLLLDSSMTPLGDLTPLWLDSMTWLYYDLTLRSCSYIGSFSSKTSFDKLMVGEHILNYYAVHIFMGTYTTYTYVVQT